MKKIFTLVLLSGFISIAMAQAKIGKDFPNNNNSKGFNQPQDKVKDFAYNNGYISFNEKEALIQKINREYNHKIADVKMNRFLKNRQKKEKIKMLEEQRKKEIAFVQYRYEKSKRYDVGFGKNNRSKW